jgi:hypothetical protein
MINFWLALLISIGFTVLVSLKAENVGGVNILYIIVFFYGTLYVVVEILKWPFGKRKIDNSKGLARYIYKEAAVSWYKSPYFSPRESIINITGEGTYAVWAGFIGALFCIAIALYQLLKGAN